MKTVLYSFAILLVCLASRPTAVAQENDSADAIFKAVIFTSQIMEDNGMSKQAESKLDQGFSYLDSLGASDVQKGIVLGRKARLRFTARDYTSVETIARQACSLMGSMEQADIFYLEAECLLAKSLYYLGEEDEMKEVLMRIGSDNNKTNPNFVETPGFVSLQNHIADLLLYFNEENSATLFYKWVVEHAKGKPSMRDSYSHAIGNLVVQADKAKDYSRCISIMDNIEGGTIDQPYEEVIRPILLNAMIEENDRRSSEYLRRYTEDSYDMISTVFTWAEYSLRDAYWSVKGRHLMQLAIKNAYLHPSEESLIMAYENTVYSRSFLQKTSCRTKELIRLHGSEKEKKALSETGMWKDSLLFSNDSNRFIYYKEAIDSLNNIMSVPLRLDKNLRMEPLATCHSFPLVQKNLLNSEAAIEFIFLREAEKLRYGALVITKEAGSPILVPLAYTDEIEQLIPADSTYSIYNKDDIYEKIWSPLQPHLAGISHIYYATTGQLNQINFDAIKNGNTILGQQYEMFRCSTTRDISDLKRQNKGGYEDAVIYADLTYSVPSTKVEAERIGKMLSKKSVSYHLYSGSKGSEESFKALSGASPSIIHLATHGFFLKDEEQKKRKGFLADETDNYFSYDQYMINSGLLLSGSRKKWEKGISVKGTEDGILTAGEISHLDLSRTSLVVLSACETGLGKLDEVEGTLGLVRALKMAGVKTILMSLWEVEDESTMEMMTYFYQYLLDGNSAKASLNKAMESMRKINSDPRYWAGFVVIE